MSPQPQPRIQCVQALVPLPLCPPILSGPTRDPTFPAPRSFHLLCPGLRTGVSRPPLPSPHPLSGCCASQLLSAPSPGCRSSGVPPPQGAGSELWPPFRFAPLLLLNDSSVSLSRMLRVLPNHRSPSSYITVLLRLLFNNSFKIYALAVVGICCFARAFSSCSEQAFIVNVVCGLLIASLCGAGASG